MKTAVTHFVWHYVSAPTLSMKERNACIREIERLTERLAAVRDGMVYQTLLQSLAHYCRLAAWPMPDTRLIGQDPKHLALEV